MEKTDDPEVFEFSVTGVSISYFYFILISFYYRELSKANHCHLEKYQKDCWFHLCQRTRKSKSTSHRKSSSNSSRNIMSCTRANSDLSVRPEYHVISFLKDGDHMRKTLIENGTKTGKNTKF